MNAAAMDTEASSDEGRPPDPDGPLDAWIDPPGEWDDETSNDGSDPDAPGLGKHVEVLINAIVAGVADGRLRAAS